MCPRQTRAGGAQLQARAGTQTRSSTAGHDPAALRAGHAESSATKLDRSVTAAGKEAEIALGPTRQDPKGPRPIQLLQERRKGRPPSIEAPHLPMTQKRKIRSQKQSLGPFLMTMNPISHPGGPRCPSYRNPEEQVRHRPTWHLGVPVRPPNRFHRRATRAHHLRPLPQRQGAGRLLATKERKLFWREADIRLCQICRKIFKIISSTSRRI